jgi:predicted Na+-dependent transporter
VGCVYFRCGFQLSENRTPLLRLLAERNTFRQQCIQDFPNVEAELKLPGTCGAAFRNKQEASLQSPAVLLGSKPNDMQLLLPAAVFVLMVSIGMSLRVPELVSNWRKLSRGAWFRLLVATFLAPAAVALVLARMFPLTLHETAGLFMVGATPGAPLLTRNLARRGFDMHLAASYQVWGATLTPIMIPLMVFAAAKLYDRNIWIPPRVLLLQIVEKEFLPLLVGMALMYFAPAFCRKAQGTVNRTGNGVLILVFAPMLWKMGAQLKTVTPWIVLAVVLLLIASIAAMRFLLRVDDPVMVRTMAVSNANRHVGLALLISGRYMHSRDALPVVACYAIAVALLMVIAPRIFRPQGKAGITTG